MNSVTLLLIATILFIIGYLFYGRYICKIVGINPKNKCPSETKRDDVDYVPTSPYILYGHHFSSIAGAGPIVGPILACLFGWGPAVLWILIGCIFAGTIHDFSALFLSIRNEGRSIAYIIEKELGYLGRQIFLIFCLGAILIILTSFTILVVDTFMASPAVTTTSILFILMAPLFGLLVRNKALNVLEASLIFVPFLFITIWIGILHPFNWSGLFGSLENARLACILMIVYYIFLASILPVWFLLQPRDYLNSYLLIVMMIMAFVGIIFSHPTINMPFYVNPFEAYGTTNYSVIPDLLPFIFITIACGACSGFHSLVASGTSSKQISSEKHIKPISMGGMYLEGLLAIIAVISVATLSHQEFFTQYTNNFKPALAFANGISQLITVFGFSPEVASNVIILAISAFILTTLDTTMRLGRFFWQELAMPAYTVSENNAENCQTEKTKCPYCKRIKTILGNRWTATISLSLILFLFVTKFSLMTLWPIFGTANQIFASITLLIFALWLYHNKKNYLVALIPCLTMTIMATWSLYFLVTRNWSTNKILSCFSVAIFAVVIFIHTLTIKRLKKDKIQEK